MSTMGLCTDTPLTLFTLFTGRGCNNVSCSVTEQGLPAHEGKLWRKSYALHTATTADAVKAVENSLFWHVTNKINSDAEHLE